MLEWVWHTLERGIAMIQLVRKQKMTSNRPLVFKGAILSFFEFEVANARNLAKDPLYFSVK